MSAPAAKTGVDDYLAAGGTVAELMLMARPFEPTDLASERLSRDEQLQAGTAELWASWRGMRTVKQSELTDWSLVRELVRRAERGGKVVSDGIRVVASVRTLALAVGVSTGAIFNALRRLEASGLLRRDNAGRSRDQAGACVLFTGSALRKQDGKGTGQEGGQGQDGDRETSPSDAPSDRGVYVAQHQARPVKSEVPELRYSRAVTSWEYDKRGRRRRVVDPLTRLGKKRQAILEHLEERGGVCTVAELMARFAGKRTRPYDFKRRTLGMLTESPAVVVIEGDVVSLGGKWRESLEHAREIAGEQEAARLQAAKYARNREAFRQRDEVGAEPVPDMTPIPDMRSPWPAHPESCACPTCEEKFGRVIGEHVEGCCCATCFTARKYESIGSVTALPRRMSRQHDKPTASPPASVAVLHEAPAEEPPDDWRNHPLSCECQRCTTPEVRYATPWSAS